jgi:hypothetical protein
MAQSFSEPNNPRKSIDDAKTAALLRHSYKQPAIIGAKVQGCIKTLLADDPL